MARRRGGRVRVVGLDRLQRRLAELPEQLEDAVRAEVQNSGAAMVADVRRNVRVDSGNLRASVAAVYDKAGLRVEVGWRDRDDLYAAIHERGSRRIPANPTLVPALERAASQLTARLRDEVRGHLR